MPTVRRKFDQALQIEDIAKNVDDIYTGGYHSFMKKTSKSTINGVS